MVGRFSNAECASEKIRLTGGEPTVRRELPELIAKLSAIDSINEIAMTTNRARLLELAKPLKKAFLNRINISLDTLRPDRNRRADAARFFARNFEGR